MGQNENSVQSFLNRDLIASHPRLPLFAEPLEESSPIPRPGIPGPLNGAWWLSCLLLSPAGSPDALSSFISPKGYLTCRTTREPRRDVPGPVWSSSCGRSVTLPPLATDSALPAYPNPLLGLGFLGLPCLVISYLPLRTHGSGTQGMSLLTCLRICHIEL